MSDHDRGTSESGAVVPSATRPSGRFGPQDQDAAAPPWLSDHRVAIPDPVTDYLERRLLTQRCMPTRQRLTVLTAPGGFGKTTLLAQCCRALAGQGVPTAWLTLSEDDEPSALDTYLAVAFQRAGLNVLESLDSGDAGSHPSYDRISALLQTLRSYAEPCVLALDELERVTRPESVALLNSLVRIGPPNLHLALACRQLPLGLDIADPVFSGTAEILTDRDFRFSKLEIAQFFEQKLSQRELAALAADSTGWPIAVRIHRNARAQAAQAPERVVRDVVENWVESRLWYDVTEEDRQLVLDVGLLDWFDAELLDKALAGAGLMGRLEGISGVAGLVEPLRGGADKVRRLHPLIREHCQMRRRRETPQRYRSIHRRIAEELASRGDTVSAMRHAAEAGDWALVGRILTDAGGIRLWLREGSDRLLAAERLMTDATLEIYPRLALARVVALSFQGRLVEARRALELVEGELTAAAPDEDLDLRVDLCLARGSLAQAGYGQLGSELLRQLTRDLERLVDLPGVDPVVRCTIETGFCQLHNLKGEFRSAVDLAERARRRVGTRSPYISMAIDFQLGQVAMAQGHVQNALDRYGSGLRAARRMFLQDPRLAVLGDVLIREVNLERNRMTEAGLHRGIPRQFWLQGSQFASYAAAGAVAAELTLAERGAGVALTLVDEMWENARQKELPAMVRYLAAMRAAMLAVAGQAAEAEWTWRTGALPQSNADCLDLGGQSWREMEMLACARLRLLVLRGDFEAGRNLARPLVAVAAGRGLRRTRMRALALALTLEEAAGERAAALDRLGDFLDLFAETDYARPLVRERDVALPVLHEWLQVNPAAPVRGSAEVLMSMLEAGTGAAPPPLLSGREAAILVLLETRTDRQIGVELGLTRAGVRYHLQHLFAKLKVRSRVAAVQSARSHGLLPPGP